MSERFVALALEAGPAGYAALRAAADLAARLRCPLRGYALAPGGIPTLRAHRRLKLAARRRGIDVSFVRPARSDLAGFAEAAVGARLLVCARSPDGRAPGLRRRLALGTLLRARGAPLLVIPKRGRPLGDRALIACAGGDRAALEPLYGLVKPLIARVSILRWLCSGGELELDPGLDDCIENAISWDERIVHGDEGHDLGDSILATAERIRPTLIVVARSTSGPCFSALLAPEATDRVVCEAPAPVIVARAPRETATSEPAPDRLPHLAA